MLTTYYRITTRTLCDRMRWGFAYINGRLPSQRELAESLSPFGIAVKNPNEPDLWDISYDGYEDLVRIGEVCDRYLHAQETVRRAWANDIISFNGKKVEELIDEAND